MELAEIGPGLFQKLHGPAVLLPQQAQKKVAAAHLLVAQAQGFLHGQLHALLRAAAEFAPVGEGSAQAQGIHEPFLDPLPFHPGFPQQAGRAALGLEEQAQEQMLAAHMIVAHALGHPARQGQGLAGVGGKGCGFHGEASFPAGSMDGGGVGMVRWGWALEQGAPSKLGVALPGKAGSEWVFCIEKTSSNGICV